MQVPPTSVGVAARAWDEQHLDLSAATDQIADAPTGGFTPLVAPSARRFVGHWERHTTGLALASERCADGLRESIRDFLRTDGAVGDQLQLLARYLVERR